MFQSASPVTEPVFSSYTSSPTSPFSEPFPGAQQLMMLDPAPAPPTYHQYHVYLPPGPALPAPSTSPPYTHMQVTRVSISRSHCQSGIELKQRTRPSA